MAVTNIALKRLLPKGRAWNLGEQATAVNDGLGEYLCAPQEFLRTVQKESRPETATEATIDEWLGLLGISAPNGTSLGDKRKLAAEAMRSTGGQSKAYVEASIQAVLPNVNIVEEESGGVLTGVYRVEGFYPFSRDRIRLEAILQRIAPLHAGINFQARAVFDGDVDRCGIGITGREITGRGATAYTDTAKQVDRCAVGRTGAEITGKGSL